jgi:aminopeptidase N
VSQPVSKTTEIFYRTLLRSHELAHQWWGNVILPDTYRDEWLVESLSNYAALMYLETRKGGDRELRMTLERSRQELLQKVDEEPAESAGPPVLGYRLNSSRTPHGVDLVMYKKGTWVIHMLRQLMRDTKTGTDANFFKFVRALRDTFGEKPLNTAEFRRIAEKFVVPEANIDGDKSLEWFFDQWVYSTGVPEVQVKSSVETRAGKMRVTGSVTLEGVDKNFTLPVPLYAQTLRGQTLLGIVAANGKETRFSFPVAAIPQRVVADPQGTLLAVIKQ